MKAEFILLEPDGKTLRRTVTEGNDLKDCQQKALEKRPNRQIKFGRILDQTFGSVAELEQTGSGSVKK